MLWLFLSLAPVCTAQAFIPAHTHMHTDAHTGAYKDIHTHLHAYAHTHLMHRDKRGKTSWAQALMHMDNTHTHTLANTGTLAVMKPEENGTMSYYFQCSNLERMCFFFPRMHNEHIDFFPLNCLEAFAYCLSSSSPVHIEMHCFTSTGSDLKGYEIGWKSACQH